MRLLQAPQREPAHGAKAMHAYRLSSTTDMWQYPSLCQCHPAGHGFERGHLVDVVGAQGGDGGDDERGAGGLRKGPEQVGAHAGNVTHVVAHVVCPGNSQIVVSAVGFP